MKIYEVVCNFYDPNWNMYDERHQYEEASFGMFISKEKAIDFAKKLDAYHKEKKFDTLFYSDPGESEVWEKTVLDPEEVTDDFVKSVTSKEHLQTNISRVWPE